MFKKYRFRGPFNKQHDKRGQTLLKFTGQYLYHIYWSLWRQLSWKKSFLVICKSLGLFAKTLNSDDKFSILNRNTLNATISYEILSERKTFSEYFSAFLKSRLNFEHFQKNVSVIDDVFLKLRTAKDVVRAMFKRCYFRGPFDNRQEKRSQTLLKFAGQHLYHIYWSLWTQVSW